MGMRYHRAAITRGIGWVVLAATALSTAGLAAAQPPSATANFKIGTLLDEHGPIPMLADWATPLSLVTAGGENLAANKAADSLRLVLDANLISVTDLQCGPHNTSRFKKPGAQSTQRVERNRCITHLPGIDHQLRP